MTELLTAAQMKAIEAAAIASGQVTGLELMERAGRGVVAAIFAEWPDLQAGTFRAVVLCGPGNNGGDGFVVARLLKQWGWEVEVFLYGTPEGMPADARVNYQRWMGMGEVVVLSFPETTDADEMLFTRAAYNISGTALIVDALFGIGLKRPVVGLDRLLQINDLYSTFSDLMPARVVAIDFPSGVCADSGRIVSGRAMGHLPWDAMQALATVTFHAAKQIGRAHV